MARYSTLLERLADTDDRVQSYEFDAEFCGGQHWLHLADGWWLPFPDCLHQIGEGTVLLVLDVLRLVRRETFDD